MGKALTFLERGWTHSNRSERVRRRRKNPTAFPGDAASPALSVHAVEEKLEIREVSCPFPFSSYLRARMKSDV